MARFVRVVKKKLTCSAQRREKGITKAVGAVVHKVPLSRACESFLSSNMIEIPFLFDLECLRKTIQKRY